MRFGAILFLLVTLGSLTFAQTQSRLTGLVTDDSGAVVAGARVVIRNVLTGVMTESATSELGNYQFPALIPSTY